MNIEKVIELARDAKLPHYYQTNEIANLDALESFANLVRHYSVKSEREEIALEFEKRHEGVKHLNNYWLHAAKYVMARGSA